MKLINWKKLTDCKWLNLFKVNYSHNDGTHGSWIMVSRNEEPYPHSAPSAVAIITYLGDKIVVIEQYRIPIDDYLIENPAGIMEEGKTIAEIARQEVHEEVGLQAGSIKIISPPLYNSAGMSDEDVVYVVTQASGTPTTEFNHQTEDIIIHIVDQDGAKELLASGKKFSAKCWFVLTAFVNGIDWRTI